MEWNPVVESMQQDSWCCVVWHHCAYVPGLAWPVATGTISAGSSRITLH